MSIAGKMTTKRLLSKDVWYEAATRANLKLGQRRRFKHNCGDGDVVLVTSELAGLSAYCFRCDDRLTIRRELSLADKIAALKARTQSTNEFRACQLPSDYTLDIPPQYAVWLYKASIRKAQARELGIGWSPSMQRILLPVYNSAGELAFVQARAVMKGQQPKYLNSNGQNAGATLFMTSAINAQTTFCVFTEDMLSAIRCGLYAPSCALCGVSLNNAKLLKILPAKTILIWLDPDPAGQKAMRKCIKQLSLLHDDVRVIHSDKDPKFLTDLEIKQHIERTLNAA